MTADAIRMMSVMSCNASHTSSRKVLAGFGGMMFEPNASRRRCRSASEPVRPERLSKNLDVLLY
jgi:hypothetical protein